MANANGALNKPVLVLNANYFPYAVCSGKRAITLYYLDKVDVLEHLDIDIHSPSTTIKLPSVLRLKAYVHFDPHEVLLNKRNIIKRDGNKCQYCGAGPSDITIDHVVPKSAGGDFSWENLVAACKECNNRKGDRTPEQAHMGLLTTPSKPHRVNHFQKFTPKIHDTWRPYLFLSPI